MGRGRPPTPTAMHLLNGTFRPDRHGGRLELTGDAPTKPEGLPPAAAELWDAVTETLPAGVLVAFDYSLLEVCCRWFSRWRDLERRLDSHQGDEATLVRMAATAATQYLAAVTKLGLSPTDRAKLSAPQGTQVDEKVGKFFG